MLADGSGGHVDAHFPAHYRREHSEGCYLTERTIELLRGERAGRGGSAADRSQTGWVLSLNYVKPHPPYVCANPYHRHNDPVSVRQAMQRPDELRAAYYGMVSELDENLGVLIDALAEAGEWEEDLHRLHFRSRPLSG